MSDVVIQIQNLNFSYNGQQVLKDVSLTVERGDFVALLGPNGGGKSTLLKLIIGILKPQKGRVLVFGKENSAKTGRIGYVPQHLHEATSLPISALEAVMMGRLGMERKGWGWSRADQKAARRALDQVGLMEKRGELVSSLSGGQRQRVFIARALVSEPEILLLDEPASSVDQMWQTRLYDLLAEINQRATILMASHDLSVISSQVKSVACINQGLFHHPSPEITKDMLEMAYQCPVELITHGHLPHRVLASHNHREHTHD